MKNLYLVVLVLVFTAFEAHAQLEDKKWLIEGGASLSSTQGVGAINMSPFVGRVLENNATLGLGVDLFTFFGAGITSDYSSRIFVEYQKYRSISDDFPIYFFYAPQVFFKFGGPGFDRGVGAGCRAGLSIKPAEKWLLNLTLLRITGEIGDTNELFFNYGTSGLGIVWLFGS